MKNSIRIFILAACCVSAVLFSSCKKEQHNALKVSIESPASTAKAHLESYYPCFIVGDKIKVNASVYSSEGKGKACEFYADAEDAVAPYYAVYPDTCVDGIVTAQPHIILPKVQHYVAEGDVQKLEAPMGGANKNPEIRFHNFCSILEVEVKNPGTATAPMTVSSIEVSSPDIKLSYPEGLQLATAMDKDHPDNVQALVAQTYQADPGPNPDDKNGVTLTIPRNLGSIAIGGTKSFMIYLPTYKSGDGSKVLLHVKVTTAETGCIASYTRSVRLDSLQRNLIYHYNFSLAPAIRKVEEMFFNLGTEYYAFTKHNEGATDQKGLGDAVTYNTYSTTSDLLTPNQWGTLFAQTGKSGLVRCENTYYWTLLPPGFEYPEGCDTITPATANNGVYTVTIRNDSKDVTTVTAYSGEKWSQMEEAGAVFLPIDGELTNATVQKCTYYYVDGMANKKNMYFYFNAEYKNGAYKSFTIQAGTNRDKIEGTYSVRVRTVQHMNLTNE